MPVSSTDNVVPLIPRSPDRPLTAAALEAYAAWCRRPGSQLQVFTCVVCSDTGCDHCPKTPDPDKETYERATH
jgi:hypothetical protein